MAQKTKEIRIGKKVITVKELSVRQIWGLVRESETDESTPKAVEPEGTTDDFSLTDITDRLDTFLGLATDISRDDLLDFYPSEVQELWDGFREVNASFLDPAGKLAKLGFDRLLRRFLPVILDVMEAEIKEHLEDAVKPTSSQPSVSASTKDITESGTMAGRSS